MDYTKCRCGHSGYDHYPTAKADAPCRWAEFGYDSDGYPMGRTCQCQDYTIGGTDVTISRDASPQFHAGHKIEEHVKVYLRLADDGTGWVIDPITFDGFPLDGLKIGPTPTESDCECADRRHCWEAHNYASHVPLPTGEELFNLMAEYVYSGSKKNG